MGDGGWLDAMNDDALLYAGVPKVKILYKPFIPPPQLGPPAPPMHGPELPTEWERVDWALTTADLTPEQRTILEQLRRDWEDG